MVIALLGGAGTGACGGPETYTRVPVEGGSGGKGESDGGAGPTADAGNGTGGAVAAGTGGIAAGGTDGGPVDAAGNDGADGAPDTGGPPPAGNDGGAGADAGASPCAGCSASVTYTCQSAAPDQAIFILNVTNTGKVAFLLADLTVRYWYTVDAGKEQEVNCDDARLGCTRLTTSAIPLAPPRTNANEYVQLGFPPGALDVGGSTGAIQLRVHNKDFTPINQSDDYSLDCATTGVAKPSMKITAYLKGALVWGTEPQ